MTESIYKEYENKYYNPDDNDKKPGDNDNWKSIQKGFHDIGATQLETSAGLTLGKGTEDETSVTAAELKAMSESAEKADKALRGVIGVKNVNFNTDFLFSAKTAREWATDSNFNAQTHTVTGLKPNTAYRVEKYGYIMGPDNTVINAIVLFSCENEVRANDAGTATVHFTSVLFYPLVSVPAGQDNPVIGGVRLYEKIS